MTPARHCWPCGCELKRRPALAGGTSFEETLLHGLLAGLAHGTELLSLCPAPGSFGLCRALGKRMRLTNPGPQVRRDDPLNLSILISGGKETNQDSPSSGE